MLLDELNGLSFTEQLDEESFDELVKRTLDTEFDDESSNAGAIVTGMLLRTALTTACLADNHQPYNEIIKQKDHTRIVTTEEYTAHHHDIVLNEYNENNVIPYRDFYKIIHENEVVYRNVLILKYRNDSFNLSVIRYTNDMKSFEKAYGKNNIAVYFVPTTIKRVAGKASNNGKDILTLYDNKLGAYGYKINGNRVEGVTHKVTHNDMESIVKALRLINNALHE